jgi:hypothetical protein
MNHRIEGAIIWPAVLAVILPTSHDAPWRAL